MPQPLEALNKIINLFTLLLLLCMCSDVIPRNPYKTGEVRADFLKGCAYLRCKRGDQCVNRKFWCKNTPCPSMLYCSKSQKESLKGPSSCDMVRCSKGFICLVRVRYCRWGEPCEQQIARCVSEREYYDGPASCIDFKCPPGLRCMLRESLCARPPCKLVKSCASVKDVNRWHGECKSLGCISDHECFLRRPISHCRVHPCKHTPDCTARNDEELEATEQCRGWVCPNGEECSAHTDRACKRGNCRISRACHIPLTIPLNVTPTTKHSWRDDVKLSFYSKLDKNISAPGMNYLTSGISTNNNKVSRDDVARDEKKSTNLFIGNSHNKSPVHVSPNPRSESLRPLSVSPGIASGVQRDVQPIVTSLSTWLNHLKQKTGVHAIEAWIKKAEKQEYYEAFLEWLESVKDMLGPAAYDLWIEEVRTMTATSLAFQKWLPPVPTNASSTSSRSVEPAKNTANVNHEEVKLWPESPKLIMYPNSKDKYDDSQQRRLISELQDTSTLTRDDSKEESYIFPPRNDTKFIGTEMTDKNRVQTEFEIPTWLPPVGMQDWQQFHTPDSRFVQQTYPFQQNVQAVPWSNQDWGFRGFNNVDPLSSWYQQFQQNQKIDSHFPNPNEWKSPFPPETNPGKMAEPRFQTNWSSWQPPSSVDLNFFRPNSWGDQTIVPGRRQLDQVSSDRRILGPGEIPFEQSLHGQSHFPPPNTLQEISETAKWLEPQFQTNRSHQQNPGTDVNFLQQNLWQEKLFSPPSLEWQQYTKYRDQYDRRFLESAKLPNLILRQVNEETMKVQSDNSTNDDTGRYPGWVQYFLDQAPQQYIPPENIRKFPSFADVPHRRTKHEDLTHDLGRLRYVGGNTEKSHETAHNVLEDARVVFRGFPWLMNQMLQDYYVHLWDQNRRFVHEKNHQENPSARSSFSEGLRGDAALRPFWEKPVDKSSQHDTPRLKYWPNAYRHNSLDEIRVLETPPSPTARYRPIEIRALNQRLNPFPQLNQSESDRDGKKEFSFSYTNVDPGHPLGVSDLWNPKFRTLLSSAVDNTDRESWSHQDLVEKKTPSAITIPSPTVPPSRKNATVQQVMPIASDDSQGFRETDHHRGAKEVENYKEDDGVFPLLLTLQGYIETSREEEQGNPAKSSKDLTILPVYTVEDSIDSNDPKQEYGDIYENHPTGTANRSSSTADDTTHLFENQKYSEIPFFPIKRKNVFEAQPAMVIQNTTGESDVEIEDTKWEYNDDGEGTLMGGQLSFFVPSQEPFTSTDGLSTVEEARDWVRSPSRSGKEDDVENDYYDGVGADYENEAISGHRNSYNSQQEATRDSANREQVSDVSIDDVYNDSDHKRFKKNRP